MGIGRSVSEINMGMKYEYKTLIYETAGFWGGKVDAWEFDVRLNELAKDGWELNQTIPIATVNYGTTRSIVLIFKREIG